MVNRHLLVSRGLELVFVFRVSIPRIAFSSISLFLLLSAAVVVRFVVFSRARRLKTLFEKQANEARLAQDLHDSMLQTIEASKMVADDALESPDDPENMRRAMSQLSDWLGRATEEGERALKALRATSSEQRAPRSTSSTLSLKRLRLWLRRGKPSSRTRD